MNISRSHAEIIQVLHDADCALSEAEIAQRLNCTTCAKIIGPVKIYAQNCLQAPAE